MAGLFHTLNIGSEALFAARQGVDTAGHNIANAQVEGYSRQRVNITQRHPLDTRGILIGNGVYIKDISRSHDKFIEGQLTKAFQNAGRNSARAEALHAVEGVFSPSLAASVSDEVTKFFNSLETLSNFPADYTVRTSVVESGKDLSAAFRRVDTDLKAGRHSLNERIGQMLGRVTEDLQQIADLNVKIQTTEAGQSQQANDLRDQRDRLVRDISKDLEVKYYEDEYGMLCIRGPSQVTLVDGGHASKLGVQRNNDNDGLFDVMITDWEGKVTRNVTGKSDGGALEAMLQVRDVDIPGLVEKNNTMAYTLGNEFNRVHRQGYGLKEYEEKSGRDFFSVTEDLNSAAANFDISRGILESNDAIAAALSPVAPGDNLNLNSLIELRDAKIFTDEGVTLNEFYANYAGGLGLDVVRSDHMAEVSDLLVNDLNNRREAVSGVSLDEEATNMMKWQANFTASSKVITTIDEMLDTVLSLKR